MSPCWYFLYYTMLTELCDCDAFRVSGEKETHLCPLPSVPGVTDRHWADGEAMGGQHTHKRKPYRGDKQGLCQSCTYIQLRCSVRCSYCTSVLVCWGEAGSIYHVLSHERMLMYHGKKSLGARTLNDIPTGRDECDLLMQVEQRETD